MRNYYEKTAKISDKGLVGFKSSPYLERLELVYTRKFDESVAMNLAQYFPNLVYLNLSGCPIQCSLEPLAKGCPKLLEFNLSGDSWVKKVALTGIAKHKGLSVFHLGHFEHSDYKC